MEEKITDTVARLEMERRIKLREERERKKKEAQRRYYIVGELFCNHFPVINNLPPGKKSTEFRNISPFRGISGIYVIKAGKSGVTFKPH